MAEAFGTSPHHTTVPQDPGLALDPTATAHLLVAAPAGRAAERLAGQWRAMDSGAPLHVLHDDSASALVEWSGATATQVELIDLEDELALLLDEARVGLRVYMTGTEAVVRRAGRIALDAGLLPGELRTEVCGTAARRVWCAHCATTTEGVRTTTAPCAGCGATLLVFDHFSRRHAAYLGFQADAEVPGDLPPVQERWT